MGINITYTCDMCKKQYEHGCHMVKIDVTANHQWDGNKSDKSLIKKRIDLCYDCYYKFVNELNERF